ISSPTMDEFITPQLTDDNYNPPVGNVTRSALNPGMSIANDNLYFGSRYRGRLYVIEAVSLLLRGELVNSDLENPVGGQATPGAKERRVGKECRSRRSR